jgi:AraC-like DNA-binding protein/mannose-6-phosphate isomerase-like protein (cupin superfamily)
MLSISKTIRFENFAIDHLVDTKGRYLLKLDPTFPLSVRPISFQCDPGQPRFNWHERLEIFVAVHGEGEFHMGNKNVRFRKGDILIIDNMKLHGLREIYSLRCRAISISFLPELVYSPGALPYAFALLVPFYSHSTGVLIVRNTDRAAGPMQRVISQLLSNYFDENRDQPGCYVSFLELLYLLSRHFSNAVTDYAEYLNRQYRLRRLAKLLDYIQANHAEQIPVKKGAEMAAMSVSRFMRFFKVSTGMTFVSYLTHVRLNIAAEMLRNPEHSVCQIAAAAGFSDQSYFGRVFHKQFGMPPSTFRARSAH